MKENIKMEIQGGRYNGGHRYYKNLKNARIAARQILNKERKTSMETVFIDLYEIKENGEKKYIESIIGWYLGKYIKN